MQQRLPLVLNLSYGNNYGDHYGNSIVEQYLDALRANGKVTIVTGMGNEGNTGRHRYIGGNTAQTVGILVGDGLLTFSLQLWFAPATAFLFAYRLQLGRQPPTYLPKMPENFILSYLPQHRFLYRSGRQHLLTQEERSLLFSWNGNSVWILESIHPAVF